MVDAGGAGGFAVDAGGAGGFGAVALADAGGGAGGFGAVAVVAGGTGGFGGVAVVVVVTGGGAVVVVVPAALPSMWNSTRRLWRRPSSLVLSRIGLSGPKPALVSRDLSTPCAMSHFTTDAARSADSFLLSAAGPWLSV